MHSRTKNVQENADGGENSVQLGDSGGVKKKKTPSNYYVDPKELKEELAKSKERDELTPQAIAIFQTMAMEASKKLRYRDEEDRKDCIAFAMMDVVRYWRSYNPEKSNNPFAYFTQMIKNGFAKGWRKLHPLSAGEKVSLSHDNVYTI
jgi:DNA-directed RNA polymerase specialized sigma subunit